MNDSFETYLVGSGLGLGLRCDDYDWRHNINLNLTGSLNEYKVNYYHTMNKIKGNNDSILNSVEVHKPESCKKRAKKY